ncbi:hypothetical protein ABPG72_007507 [Tetrahymena utriculariae]
MSNPIPIALGVFEGQENLNQQEQNKDKKDSQSENNSQKIKDSEEVIISEEIDNGGYFDRTNYDVYNVKRDGYFFADEVKVDGETIFTIPIEKQLEDNQDLPKRKSRWGDRPQRRRKAQVNHIFNPLQGLTTGNGLLSITADGYKYGQQYPDKKEEEEEKFSRYFFQKELSSQHSNNKILKRWGPEYEKTFHPPPLNCIPQTINDDDLEYIIRLYRLDEIQNKMINKIQTLEDDIDCRSPSPDPIYNEQGKRINTRDYREQESLQKEKYNLIEEAMRINPAFIPPHDFKVQKKQKKIYLPEQNAELLKQKVIGPKGQTHKRLEQESGCKISIKGKGSGNGMKRVENDFNDKLHILLQGDTDEQLEKGATLVDEILRGEDKSNENTFKGGDLAIIHDVINRDFCSKCHQTGHRDFECQSKTTFNKVDIKCMYCGDKGHVSADCKFKREYQVRQQYNRDRGNDVDINTQFEQFINQVEGDDKLLSVRTTQNKISSTSFITDAIEIDPNLLMIKADESFYRNTKEPTFSNGPSGSSYSNDFQQGGYNNFNKNRDNKLRESNDQFNKNNDRFNSQSGNNRQLDASRAPAPPPILPPGNDHLVPPSFMNQNTMAHFSGLPIHGIANPPVMPPPGIPGSLYPPPMPPGGYPMFNPYAPPGFIPPMYPPPPHLNTPSGYNPLYPQGFNQQNQPHK